PPSRSGFYWTRCKKRAKPLSAPRRRGRRCAGSVSAKPTLSFRTAPTPGEVRMPGDPLGRALKKAARHVEDQSLRRWIRSLLAGECAGDETVAAGAFARSAGRGKQPSTTEVNNGNSKGPLRPRQGQC